jgi:hypothetical protein
VSKPDKTVQLQKIHAKLHKERAMATVFPYYTEVSGIKGPPQGQWTRADWEKLWHEGNHYEVIDGVLYVNPWPSVFHSWIVKELYHCLGMPAEDRKLAYVGLAEWVCDAALRSVQPDFVLVLADMCQYA